MEELHEKRGEYVKRVRAVVAGDLMLNGLELETVSLTQLDQTGLEYFNPSNAFDAEGLTRLTEQIERRKKIRNDKGYWEQLEHYLSEHTQAEFSHGICPECMELLYPEFLPAEASDEATRDTMAEFFAAATWYEQQFWARSYELEAWPLSSPRS